MPETFSLALQAFPSIDKDKQSLEYLISRVNEQKCSFRNITEESLQKEIQTLDTAKPGDSQDDVLGTVERADELKSKGDIFTAREGILKEITQALTESSFALDLVSLLLSKHAPAVAQQNMSPLLKQNIPSGTLGGDVVQTLRLSETEKHNQEMVLIGWRMQSLNSAADSLLKSASRLEQEVWREATFWNQVLSVKEKGWSLSRLPRESHTLGVRFGFAEAYSDFRDRGLAALRRDEGGNLSLDYGSGSKRNRKVRVRILQQGNPIASTGNPTDSPNRGESVEEEIVNARNSIFDEELHHEIHREARNLVNQGVRCVGTSVVVPYELDKQIEIDLVTSEDTPLEDIINSSPVVDYIATSLRILLSYAHRQSLHKRSQKPPPLREGNVPRPIYPILRPFVEHLQHLSHVRSLQNFIEGLRATLNRAALNLAVETTMSYRNLSSISASAAKSAQYSTIEALLQQFTSPLRTVLTLRLADEATILTIDIHTTLYPPSFGTSFQVTNMSFPSTGPMAQLPQSMRFTMRALLESHVLHMITLSILQHLLSNFNTWRTLSPHSTTIMRNRPGTKDKEMASVLLATGQMSITWQRNGRLRDQRTWNWNDRGLEDGGQRSLFDVFREY